MLRVSHGVLNAGSLSATARRLIVGVLLLSGGALRAAIPTEGLKLWYRADSVTGLADGAALSLWADESGQHLDVSQGSAPAQPHWFASAYDGKPAVYFDGGDALSLPGVPGSSLGAATEATLFLVIKPSSSDTRNTIFSWGTGSNRYYLHTTWDAWLSFQYGDPTYGVSWSEPAGWQDAWHTVLVRRQGAQATFLYDGVWQESRTIGSSLPTGLTQTLYVGTDEYGNNQTGYLHALLAYDRALSDAECRELVRAHSALDVDVTTPDAVVPYATLSYEVAGTASNVVGMMTWSNALTSAGGSFAAATNWAVAGIALQFGANVVTVTGTNAAGTMSSDSVTITREGGGQVLYWQDFEGAVGPEWEPNTVLDNSYPATFTRFSGRYANGGTTLTLSNLVAGVRYGIEWNLYVLDTWDNGEPWTFSADGNILATYLFYVWGQGSSVPFWPPDMGPTDMGFWGYPDQVYRSVASSFVATGSVARLSFTGSGMQDVGDESWGIDNVFVFNATNPPPTWIVTDSTASDNGVWPMDRWSVTATRKLDASAASSGNPVLAGAGPDVAFGTADDFIVEPVARELFGSVLWARGGDAPVWPGRYRLTTGTNLLDIFGMRVLAYTNTFDLPDRGWTYESAANSGLATASDAVLVESPAGSGFHWALCAGAFEKGRFDEDYWRVTLQAGDVLSYALQTRDGQYPRTLLENGDGGGIIWHQYQSTHFSHRQAYTVTTPGVYYIYCSPGDGNWLAGTPYRLALSVERGRFHETENNRDQANADAYPLAVQGETLQLKLSGRLSYHDEDAGCDVFSLGYLTGGGTLTVTPRFPAGSLLDAGTMSIGVQTAGAGDFLVTNGVPFSLALPADTTYYVRVSASAGYDVAAVYLLDVAVLDVDSPEVAACSFPAEGSVVTAALDRCTLTFSERLDPASVQSAGAVTLRGAGPDDAFDTADDDLYALSLTYDGERSVTAVSTACPLQPGQRFRLRVTPAVTDRVGHPLAAVFERLFTVAPRPGYVVEQRGNEAWATATPLGDVATNGFDGSLVAAAAVYAGPSAHDLVVGDFDRDGNLDAAVTCWDADALAILLGDGRGGLQSVTNIAVGDAPLHVAAGDVDGDGDTDLLVNLYYGNRIKVLLGDGAGGFAVHATDYALGGRPHYALALADFDRDGRLDVAAASYDTPQLWIFRGNGDGTFADPPVTYPVGNSPLGLAVADFDLTNGPDVVVANYSDGTVSLLLNDGSGAFPPAQTFSLQTGAPHVVKVADLNADGLPDVICSGHSSSVLAVLYGQGPGAGFGLGGLRHFACGASPVGLCVFDADLDGRTNDVAVASYGGHGVDLFQNDGAGGLTNRVFLWSDYYTYDVAAGDFDRDGSEELLATSVNGGTVRRFLPNRVITLPQAATGPGVREAYGYGNLRDTGDADWWAFTGRAGQRVLIGLEIPGGPPESGLFVQLYQPDGNRPWYGYSDYWGYGSWNAITLGQSGRYFVGVSYNNDYRGEYRLRITVLDPDVQPEAEDNDNQSQATFVTTSLSNGMASAKLAGVLARPDTDDFFALGNVVSGSHVRVVLDRLAMNGRNPVALLEGVACDVGGGAPNRALNLDGSGDCAFFGYWAPTGTAWSVQAWAQPLGPMSGRRCVAGALADSRDWAVGVNNDQWCAIFGGGSVMSGPACVAGQWAHLAATCDSSTLRLYVDGALVGQTGVGVWWPTVSGFLAGGASYSWGSENFNGFVDEVAAWNRALTADEVASNALGRVTVLDDLAGRWNFDDGTLADLSGNNRNGQYSGNAVLLPAATPFAAGAPDLWPQVIEADALADGPLYLRVSEANRAASFENGYLASVELTDLAPPRVTACDLPPEGGATTSLWTRFTVSFSKEMMPASAASAANYELRQPGPDTAYGTGDDLVYGLSVSYSSGLTATFALTDGPLQPGPARFTAKTTLVDRTGNALSPLFVRAFTMVQLPGFINENRANNGWAGSTSLSTNVEAAADGSLFQLAALGTGANPDGLVLRDLDGDGHLDLAVACHGVSRVYLYRGLGDGSFAGVTNWPVAAQPLGLTCGDFNADGVSDLAAACYNGQSVSILLGQPGGFPTNAGAFAFTDGPYPYYLTAADLDGDGDDDLAVTCVSGSLPGVRSLLSNRDGTFTNVQSVAVGYHPTQIGAADLDGDGILDLVTPCWSAARIELLRGVGDGTFEAPVVTPTAGGQAGGLGFLPPGADGLPRLVVGNYGNSSINAYAVRPDLTCTQLWSFAGVAHPWGAIGVRDWSGDGIADVAAVGYYDHVLHLLRGLSGGGWSQNQTLATGAYPRNVAVGDIDEDGLDDVVVAGWNDSALQVYRSVHREPLPLTAPGAGLRSSQGFGCVRETADVDYWSFYAEPGERVQVAVEVQPRAGDRSLYVAIYQPDGGAILSAYSDWYGDGIWGPITINEQGRHYLRLSYNNLFDSPYRIRISTVAPPVAFETENNDSLGSADAVSLTELNGSTQGKVVGFVGATDTAGDYFSLGNLASGTVVQATLELPADSPLAPRLRLLDGGGNEWASTNGSALVLSLPGDQPLYVHVDAADGATRGLLSQYALTVALDDATPPQITGTTLPADGATNDTAMVSGFQVGFSEEMLPGSVTQPGQFTLVGAGADDAFGTGDDEPYLVSVSYSGGLTAQVAVADGPLQAGVVRFAASTNLTDRFRTPLLPYAQTFVIGNVAGWTREGRTNDTLAAASALPLTSGDGARRGRGAGRFETAGDADCWAVEGLASEQLVVLSEFDPLWSGDRYVLCEVYDPSGSRIYGEGWGSTYGFGQFGPVTLPAAGRYVVRLRPYSYSGTYRLIATLLPPDWTAETEVNNDRAGADALRFTLGAGVKAAAFWGVHMGDDGADTCDLGYLGSNVAVRLSARPFAGAASNATVRLLAADGSQLAPAEGAVTGLVYVTASPARVYAEVAAGGPKGMDAGYVLDCSAADSTPPFVTGTSLPANGTVSDALISAFTVSFSEEMDAASVTAAASYSLREAGADREFGNADDRVLALTPGSYSPGLPLALGASPAPLGPGLYRFEARSVIRDAMQNAMGQAFLRDFEIASLGHLASETPGNDSAATATPVAAREVASGLLGAEARGLLQPANEQDWFSVAAVSNELVVLSAQVQGGGYNRLAFDLLDEGQAVLATLVTGTGGARGQLAGVRVGYTGTLFVRVRPFDGTAEEYRWRLVRLAAPWQAEAEPNDARAQASAMAFEVSGESRAALLFAHGYTSGDPDWIALGTVTNGESILLAAQAEGGSGLLPAVSVYDAAGLYVPETGAGGDGVAEVRVHADGSYFAHVVPLLGGGDPQLLDGYALRAQVVPTGSLRVPNLVVDAVGLPLGAGLRSGDGVSFQYVARNAGATNLPASVWFDRVVLSADTVLGNGDDVQLTTLPNSLALADGAAYTNTVALNLPEGLAGVFHVLVEADAGRQVDEGIYESDNVGASSGTFAVALADYADLVVENAQVAGAREAGKALTASWSTRNAGVGGTVGGFEEYVRVRRVATGQNVFERTFTRPAFAAGDAHAESVTFTLTANGAYDFIVTTDAGLDIFEHNGVSHAAGELNTVTLRLDVLSDRSGPDIQALALGGAEVTNGLVVRASGALSATCSDPAGMGRVEFYADGARFATALGQGPQFAAEWAVDDLSDGPHALAVRAVDALGNSAWRSNTVELALGPPSLAPTLTEPGDGAAFARSPVLVRGLVNGRADEVIVFLAGATGAVATVASDRSFAAWVTLSDGTNEVRAAQVNRAGTGPLSEPLRLILDRSVPAVPSRLEAASREGGEVRLTWWQPAGGRIAGYHVFRAAASFATTSEAVRVTSELSAAASWTDLPPSDGDWTYRVAAVNDVGTWSALSEPAQALSDRTPPAAAIGYTTTGARVGDRFGPGIVTLSVTLTEKAETVPFLSLTRTNGTPVAITLARQSDTLYRGQLAIGSAFGTADLFAIFSARDAIGNRGTQVTSGGQITADTDGPAALAAVLTPDAPLANDPPGPHAVGVTLHLDPADLPVEPPALFRTLSQTQPEAVPVALTALDGASYGGTFDLPAEAGATPEALELHYRGVDALGNTGTVIRGWASAQVYQGALPALPPPDRLTATAGVSGRVDLAWSSVAGASGYAVFRRAPTEEALSLLAGTPETAWGDRPPEGLNRYAVATVRSANGQAVTGALSQVVSVSTDATPPPAPQGMMLWGLPQGIVAQWLPVSDSGAVFYRLYRDVHPVTNAAALGVLIDNIVSTQALDTVPLPGDSYYAVTARDAAGNESAPSASVYTNLSLLPVRSIRVDRTGDAPPVLSWQHAAPAQIDGFRAQLLRAGEAPFNLHAGLLAVSSNRLTDTGYDGTNRHYSVTAVAVSEGQEHPSLARDILLPALTLTPVTNAPLARGVMNRVAYRLANRSAQALHGVRVGLSVAGHESWSDLFSLGAAETGEVAVVVGGHADLPDTLAGTNTVWMNPAEGEDVYIRAPQGFTAVNNALSLSVMGYDFVRGASGQCRFELVNTASETVEIVAARASGGADSPDVRFQLESADGNVYVTLPWRQATGAEVLTLADGRSVVRLAPGASFVCQPLAMTVPSAVPDTAVLRVVIDALHNGLGTDRPVTIAGLSARSTVSLTETPYYGTLTNVAPAAVMGTNPVRLAGQALRRADGSPQAGVPVRLIVARSGFERAYTLYTDDAGGWQYEFSALASESGRYTVHVLHPDSHERPGQGGFLVQRVWIAPTEGSVTLPREYDQSVWVDLGAGDGTAITNARVVYRPEDQPGGVLATGVTVTLPQAADVAPGTTARFPVTLRADTTAAQYGRLVLRVVSDAPAPGDWGTLTLQHNFLVGADGDPAGGVARPILAWTPGFIETGVTISNTATAQVELRNVGYAPMQDVRVMLVTTNGEAAPDWVLLNGSTNFGTLAVAERRAVDITFAPDAAVEPRVSDPYEFRLRVWAANHATNEVPLFVAVDDAGRGNALFHVMDIYTGTLDGQGQPILGLTGARIELVREEAGLPFATNITSDAAGEALVRNLPEGRYRVRISASDHLDKADRIWVRPGTTLTREYTLESPLVTVEWEVTEITVQDRYEIVLRATYKTDVPAAVVVIDPPSVTIPDMQVGEVFNGEFTLKNYGLIRAENVTMPLSDSDEFYKFELLAPPPATLEAKQVAKVAYRITCLKRPGGDATGGGCFSYSKCKTLWYIYKCSNGAIIEGTETFCTTQADGADCGSGGTGTGWGGWGWWGWWGGGGGPGGGGPSGGSSGPGNTAISGVVCGPKIYCELWDECCKAKAREAVKSSVNLLMGEYNDELADLRLRVSGFNLEARRSYYRGGWLHSLDALGLSAEPDGLGGVSGLSHAGAVYQPADDNGKVFTLGDRTLTVTDTGYRYGDKQGNWKTFDDAGRLLRAGNRNGRYLDYIYGSDGLVSGVLDQRGQQVLWVTRESGRITGVHDDVGRAVAYHYDANGNLDRFTSALGTDTLYTYDADNRLVKKQLPTGKTFTITYNAEGYVTSVVDEAGAGKFFEYGYDAARREYYAFIRTSAGEVVERWFNSEGQPIQRAVNGVAREDLPAGADSGDVVERDGEGRVTRVTYPDGTFVERDYAGPYGQLSRERNALGVETRYTYDERGNLASRVEAWGSALAREIRYGYDADGNLTEVRQLADALTPESVVQYGYDADGNRISTIDAEGNVSSNRCDRMGNPIATWDACGAHWAIVYDAAGNLLSKTGPGGYAESNVYDTLGRRVQAIDALGRTTAFASDEEGRVIAQADPWARTNTFAYDYEGRLVRHTDEDGRQDGTDYDVEGHIVRHWEFEGRVTSYGYDDSGRLVSVTQPDGRAGTNTYDAAGHLVAAQQPGFTQVIVNDARGRPVAVTETGTDGAVRQSWRVYDELGRAVLSSNALGEVSATAYDLLGRKTSETQGGGTTATYLYDGRNNVVRVTDGKGQSTEIEYDRNNRPVLKRFADGACLRLAYDGCGRMTRFEDASGRQIGFGYDALGRLVERRYYAAGDTNTPVRTVAFTYDLAGRPTGWSDGAFSGQSLYDEARRRVLEIVNYGPFSVTNAFAFDARGRTTAVEGPQGSAGYVYGGDGLLHAVDLGDAGSVTFDDFLGSLPRAVTLPGGAQLQTDFGSFAVLSNRLVGAGGATLFESVPQLAGGDRLTALARTEGDYAFSYSGAQALLGENLPPALEAAGLADRTYAYDAAGNLVALRFPGSTNELACNALNQATSVNGAALAYDVNGNLVERHDGAAPVYYAYDGDNRLTEVYDASSNLVARYRYDPQGRRLSKESGGQTTYFLYGDQGLLAELDASGALVRGYSYLPSTVFQGRPLAQRSAAGVHFFVNDHLGAPALLVEGAGDIVWRAYRSAYGQTVIDPASTVTCPLRASAQYADDETGLHYNLHRYYDPSLGRYLTRDPIGTAGGVNLYAFAGGDPLGSVDPLGLAWQELGCVKIKASVSVAAYVGVGGKLEAAVYGQKCDCCNMETGEFRKWDKLEVGAEAAATVGLGIGGEVTVGGIGIDLALTGPSVSVGDGGSVYKDCGAPWKDVTLKRSRKVELFLGWGAEGAAGVGASYQSGSKLVAEMAFELSRNGLKASITVDKVTFYTWGVSAGPVGVELPNEQKTNVWNPSLSLPF